MPHAAEVARGTTAAEAVHVLAPAKINLYLGVHDRKDAAGYHRVDSVMAALSLADEVLVERADGLSVGTEPDLGIPQEQNTAWRAAEALGHEFGRAPDVRISIEKRIPVCAGLGGPSTDAAAVLVGLCELWGVDAHDPRVEKVARSVGADVPFFLHGGPAYLSGRGDAFEESFDTFTGAPVALVKPLEGGLTTAEAYRRFDEDPAEVPSLEPLLRALRKGRTDDVPGLVANNLKDAACSLEPRIAQVLAWLGAQPNVLAADMCGSGPTCYALCESAGTAEQIAADAGRTAEAETGGGWWACAASVENYGARTTGR